MSLYLLIFSIICIILYILSSPINIIFLNNKELSDILIKDYDNFYKNLSTINLQLRNINNKDEYLYNIENHLYTPTKKEKKIIKNAIYKAENKLKNKHYMGFNYNKIQKSPWVIGCSIGENYEFGYPHTRNNIIILNYNNIYDKDLYKTLIHERIHVYQKLFPKDMNKFLKYFGFEKIKRKDITHLDNPDTNNYIYKKNDFIFECNIIDNNLHYTNLSSQYEHPYEYMAYIIVDQIT
jgi:hypothetical protein